MTAREELAADIRRIDGKHNLGASALSDALLAEGWRKMPSRESVWNLADEMLEHLNIEDLNPPSLSEYMADAILALMDGSNDE